MLALARTLALAALPVLALVACHAATPEPAGKVSAGEAKALEDAAAMLDERRLPPEALPSDAPSDTPPQAPSPVPAEMTGDEAAQPD
ncbi:hypothetical protein SOQ14_08335 [Erythrobacter sp. T5W1-R]|uniref:hypothetical protein n=1 Tax=Erythrobacter sp. T5W1-R TaxID=3101752 RepID=UPI002AFE9596|nr:hypothetical protein [Erythrobacter sp. T5W1-R]MEA1618925.1 hypothetical protein [Erythrobacter sp. T5W1-R]